VGDSTITTIEAIGATPAGAKIQKAWLDREVPQCGYCQSGQIMSASALLASNPRPTAHAADAADYEVASSLVCDTQEQVERFVALFAGDAQAATRLVNAEQKNPTACAMMNIAFVRGNHLGTARHGDNAFHITHILVIGVENGNGIQPVQPAAYYSAFGVREFAI